MNCLEMAYCSPYAPGHPRKLGVSAWHERKEKWKNGCERNFKGRFSEELPWRVVQQFISEADPWLFRKNDPAIHLGG